MYISYLALDKRPRVDLAIRFIGWGPIGLDPALGFKQTTASSATKPVSKPVRLTRFIGRRLSWSDSGFTFTLWWIALGAFARVVCSLGAWPGPLSFR